MGRSGCVPGDERDAHHRGPSPLTRGSGASQRSAMSVRAINADQFINFLQSVQSMLADDVPDLCGSLAGLAIILRRFAI
jgi:hypothetical protein